MTSNFVLNNTQTEHKTHAQKQTVTLLSHEFVKHRSSKHLWTQNQQTLVNERAATNLEKRPERQPRFDVSHFIQPEMREIILLCTPRRRQIAEVLGVHEALFERALRNRQKEECNETQAQSLHQPVNDDHILPVIPTTICNC